MMEKQKALEMALSQIEKQFGKGAVMKLGDAAAIVGNGDGVAGVDGDGNVFAVARQGFVNGVIYDLIHQMVQTGGRGGTDIHTGSLPDSLQTLQNLDLRAAIFLGYFCFIAHKILFS